MEIGLYYLQSRYYNPTVGRFVNGDAALYMQGTKSALGLNLIHYCFNSPMNYFDPNGKWVLSIGLEGQAAFALGVYAGIAINIDGKWNVSVTYTVGFAIITNIAACIQMYIASYLGKSDVSQLKGWGISVGVSFSFGVHLSGGASLDVGFDSSVGGNINFGYGFGASLAPVPYFQTRIGYTGCVCKINLLTVLRSWRNRSSKTYRFVGMYIVVTKYKDYIAIYISPLKKTIYLYKNGRIKIR